ncbi:MAG: GAF domain-containing protein [Halanaeroarchaeum sp.]
MAARSDEIRVLYVDDESELAGTVAAVLESDDERFTVDTAERVSEGLDRLSTTDYDCVVSDYDMPGQDGITFLSAVRDSYSDLPFVLFTGEGSEAVASEAIAAGATDYLPKGAGTDQFELLATRIETAVEQYRSTQRVAALDRVRSLASDVNEALVRAESRSDAEQRICEVMAASDPYVGAWIGDVDPETDRVEPQTAAGIDPGYLDGLTITVDDTPTGQGPGGTAIREGRVAVAQHIAADPDFEPWRAEALEYGFEAAAAVPLLYEDTLYGELVVYADRPHAFGSEERDLLAELGDSIAYAFDSFDVRDRAQILFANAPSAMVYYEFEAGEPIARAVNPAFERIFGYEATAVVDEPIDAIVVPSEGQATAEAINQRVRDGERVELEVERQTTHGPRDFILSSVPISPERSGDRGFVIYNDITDIKQYERTLEGLHRASNPLLEATSRDAACERVVEIAAEVLDHPYTAVFLHDADADVLRPAANSETARETFDAPPTFPVGEGLVGTVFETGEQVVLDDAQADDRALDEGAETIRGYCLIPLGDHGVLTLASPTVGAFDDQDVELAELLGLHTRVALDRIAREERLRSREAALEAQKNTIDALHDIGTAIVTSDAADAVYDLVVEAAETILEFDVALADAAEGDALVLKAVSSELQAAEHTERTPIDADDNLAARAYRTGEPSVVDDLRTHDSTQAETTFRSALTIPIGDHGVFQSLAREPAAYDESDRRLTELLVAYAEERLTQLATERQLRERTAALQRQNDRLEEFASVVSHDLRNPLNVAQGRLALAREETHNEHLDEAADAVDRSLALIDDLLTLAREGTEIGTLETVDLEAVATACWGVTDAASATFQVAETATITADRSRLKQLLENLFRNAIEHGGEDVTVTLGTLETGFYVEDDGPGIPASMRETLFEMGASTGADGLGLGLNIVRQIVEAHGWAITATESAAGGARFEITGVEGAERPEAESAPFSGN